MRVIVVMVIILAVIHIILGLMSVCLGVIASIQADIWLAHSVSPIWSGAFFAITGILGFACAKKRTAYMIMCFTAFSIVSLVTAVVNIQLLRLGLVNETTEGDTYQKENMDKLIIVALGVASVEILICIISSLVSCRLARKAKNEMERKRDGTFHVQEEEDNNNKCVIYSVEKGYHNPYSVDDYNNAYNSNDSGEFFNLCMDDEEHVNNSTTLTIDVEPQHQPESSLTNNFVAIADVNESSRDNVLPTITTTTADVSSDAQEEEQANLIVSDISPGGSIDRPRSSSSVSSLTPEKCKGHHSHRHHHHHHHHRHHSSKSGGSVSSSEGGGVVTYQRRNTKQHNTKSKHKKNSEYAAKLNTEGNNESSDPTAATVNDESGNFLVNGNNNSAICDNEISNTLDVIEVKDNPVRVEIGDQTDDEESCHKPTTTNGDADTPMNANNSTKPSMYSKPTINLDASLNLNRPLGI